MYLLKNDLREGQNRKKYLKNVQTSRTQDSTMRKIRQKDKLAMQDEYVEREYQKLRQAARRQGVASDTVSQ